MGNRLIPFNEIEAIVKSFDKTLVLKCNWCGKFISTKTAYFHFIPDSVCGPEESYWECKKCLMTTA